MGLAESYLGIMGYLNKITDDDKSIKITTFPTELHETMYLYLLSWWYRAVGHPVTRAEVNYSEELSPQDIPHFTTSTMA